MAISRFSAAMAWALPLLILAPLASADSYKLDPVHSAVVFRIQHLKSGYVWGMIGGPTGTIEYDAADPSKLAFTATASLDKLDTQNQRRDADLRGPDWFNAKQFPTIDFKSTSVKKTGDNTYDVTGDLTLHGVTKSVTVPMEMTGAGKGMRGESLVGFETTFTIHRGDFDMKGMVGPVGDEVRIIVAMEAEQQ